MKHTILCLLLLVGSAFCWGQKENDIIHQIENEGINNSQVMSILSSLVDVHSPRLSGSKAYYEGAEWVKNKMESWDCEVALEPYDFPVQGWESISFSVAMTSPRFEDIIAHPVAWSGSTQGTVTSEPILIDVFNLEQLKQLKGSLEGKIILHTKIAERLPKQETVLTKHELDSVSGKTPTKEALAPYKKYVVDLLSEDRQQKKQEELMAFLKAEKVGAVLVPSVWDNHILEVSNISFQDVKNTVPVPFLIISKESSVKILNMVDKKETPKLSVNSQTKFYDQPENNVNILADIKGSDPSKSDELVIVGAHFDTWHGGGNASDNNAGVAIIMEAFRILKTLGLKPKRTIRAGFWGGEEQEFYGSVSYLKNHIGDVVTDTYKPEHAKISAYYNIDSGGGAIRSFFTQGNEKAQHILTPWAAHFKKWGLEHISAFPSGGSDHMIFNAANIPSFDAYQDPSFYWSLQHHTNADEIALIEEEPMKRNAVIMAVLIYKTAMMDTIMPRN